MEGLRDIARIAIKGSLEDGLFLTNGCDFSHKRPFAFHANPDGEHWTPAKLEDELGIETFGQLQLVLVSASVSNLHEVVRLAEWWTSYKFNVRIHFPVHLAKPSPKFDGDDGVLGLTSEECYMPAGQMWVATSELRHSVNELFTRNRRVKVELFDLSPSQVQMN